MRSSHRPALLLLALAATPGISPAQSLIHEIPGPFGGGGVGSRELDLDADGRSDVLYRGRVFSGADASVLLDLTVAVGNPRIDTDVVGDLRISGDGIVDFAAITLDPILGPKLFAISGANGAVLAQRSVGGFTEYGSFVVGVGDADGDGVPDLVAGTQAFEGPCQFETSRISFVSGGGEGFSPWYFNTSEPFGSYTWGAPLGDVNGDGKTNFAVRGTCGIGQVVFSATAGGPYVQLYSVGNTPLYSSDRIAAVGDYDRDGFDDFATFRPSGNDPERVAILSGLDRRILASFPDAGMSVACPGDLDLDGSPDLLVGDSSTGTTRLFSGRTGAVLWVAPDEARSVHRVGDVDGDGLPDMGLELPNDLQVWSGAGLAGRVRRAGAPPEGPLSR